MSQELTASRLTETVLSMAQATAEALSLTEPSPECLFIGLCELTALPYATLAEWEETDPEAPYREAVRTVLLVKRAIKGNPSLIRRFARRRVQQMAAVLSDDGRLADLLLLAEELAQRRGQSCLSCDLLVPFTVAVLHDSLQGALRGQADRSVAALFEELDRSDETACRYIDAIEALRENRRRAERLAAAAQPVIPPIGDPEALCERIRRAITVEDGAWETVITLPYEFPQCHRKLMLYLSKRDGKGYRIHDGGLAFAVLRARGGRYRSPEEHYGGLIARLCRRFSLSADNGVLSTVGSTTQRMYQFMQAVFLIANADLYPDLDPFEEGKPPAPCAEELAAPTEPPEGLGARFLRGLSAEYDESLGTVLRSSFVYDREFRPMHLRLLPKANGRVRLIDYGKEGDGGSVLYRLEANNDDYRLHHAVITAINRRFGTELTATNLSLTFSDDAPEALPRALFAFLGAASLFGELGREVE